MKQIRPFTALWGDKHFDWFVNGCLKSLAWPKNKEELAGCSWGFLTRKEDVKRIQDAVTSAGIKPANFDFYTFDEGFDQNPHFGGVYLKEALVKEIGWCLNFNAQTIIIPPDSIYGDGTIKNIRTVGEQKDSVVFVVHPRTHPDILDMLNEKPLTNANLVHAVFDGRLHKTWSEAQVGLAQTNSWLGGVSWTYLDENLYSCTHLLPTPYLINWVPEDIVYWRQQIHFGEIDHAWSGAMLIPSQRQRLIGSSDGAFIVEITESDNNIPPVTYAREGDPTAFFRDKENRPHNIVNRMQSIIFRGDPI